MMQFAIFPTLTNQNKPPADDMTPDQTNFTHVSSGGSGGTPVSDVLDCCLFGQRI